MSLYCLYVCKKQGFDFEAKKLLKEIRELLGIKSVNDLNIVNRYYVSGISSDVLEKAKGSVFSEPQVDVIVDALPLADEAFAVEYMPGQFDQRADSCEQCIQFISGGDRPHVKAAKVYLLYKEDSRMKISEEDVAKIKKHIINPVESRESSLDVPHDIDERYEEAPSVEVVEDFPLSGSISDDEANAFINSYGLAMDAGDLRVCAEYFAGEKRLPTMTELKVIDTYWSDHCRHTTFSTELSGVKIDDAAVQRAYERYLKLRKSLEITKPVTFMDMATIVAKHLKVSGVLTTVLETEEINACTVKVKVNVNGKTEDWLYLFKNETHNHPTEIEPFGGAATCIGGAIRDPLSGRSYVYQAMRLSGAGDPNESIEDTLAGKLPQRTIVQNAAFGYSSYGNQVGLATGLVDEVYHPGFRAKRMEVGAVVGAVEEAKVRHLKPEHGDVIVLLGGKTGRDGCGGATGSSKSHDMDSITSCGAEVQKGNAPEERKLQRLFRNPEVSFMIKRCNDFGAGGVSVAIGELADGILVNLDRISKKYEGLSGTELAISESQERMAVVIAREDLPRFMEFAEVENLEARHVADVTSDNRIIMKWRGDKIVDLSRDFLNTNGARKETAVHFLDTISDFISSERKNVKVTSLKNALNEMVADLNVASKRGLSEMFDSTIGAGNLMFPFGGKRMKTPASVMASRFPVKGGNTDTCSMMAYGYNPYIFEISCYAGANLAVIESVAKLVAAGGDLKNTYLSFQEYFEKLKDSGVRWGKPMAALMGAFDAQMDLKIAAIGGKDSMSGSFEELDVPPTLISFATSVQDESRLVSEEFKQKNADVLLINPALGEFMLPQGDVLRDYFDTVSDVIVSGVVASAGTPTYGGIAERIFKMSLGNGIGFRFDDSFDVSRAFMHSYGSFILELKEGTEPCDVMDELNEKLPEGAEVAYLGRTSEEYVFSAVLSGGRQDVEIAELEDAYYSRLSDIFPFSTEGEQICDDISKRLSEDASAVKSVSAPELPKKALHSTVKPRVLIPVFPGTNCEYDTQFAFEDAGADVQIMVIRNLTAQDVRNSVQDMVKAVSQSQIIMIPGGFSGGDEPDGSGKFITSFFKNPELAQEVQDLLNCRDGLIGGICNGFQALIKLGLIPYGEIRDATSDSPTIAGNDIGRHQSRIVRTKVVSNKSPWLLSYDVGDIHAVAISHGEGKFVCREDLLRQLIENGQIATQYVDSKGVPTMDIEFNPNGSLMAIEGITSPDGRVFGKMGHTERMRRGLYKNIGADNFGDNLMFANAVRYFK